MSNVNMSEKRKKFQSDLKRLIMSGELLQYAIMRECDKEGFDKKLKDMIGKEDAETIISDLPDFKREYQKWYSESLALVKQVLPDRLQDFISYFEYPRARKAINSQNYMIRDYLQGVEIKNAFERKIIVSGSSAIPEFQQQLNIVKAAEATLASSLMDLKSILQADLFDSEIDSANELARLGFLRAAGAICGVVIEKHLNQVCENHNVTIRRRNPTIATYNDALKDADILPVASWRFIQHLADIRNACDHHRDVEPKKEEVEDLVAGTKKVLKTIF